MGGKTRQVEAGGEAAAAVGGGGGGVGAQIKWQSTEKQLITSETLCLSSPGLVVVDLRTRLSRAADVVLTSILFMFICRCLLESNTDRSGLNACCLTGSPRCT